MEVLTPKNQWIGELYEEISSIEEDKNSKEEQIYRLISSNEEDEYSREEEFAKQILPHKDDFMIFNEEEYKYLATIINSFYFFKNVLIEKMMTSAYILLYTGEKNEEYGKRLTKFIYDSVMIHNNLKNFVYMNWDKLKIFTVPQLFDMVISTCENDNYVGPKDLLIIAKVLEKASTKHVSVEKIEILERIFDSLPRRSFLFELNFSLCFSKKVRKFEYTDKFLINRNFYHISIEPILRGYASANTATASAKYCFVKNPNKKSIVLKKGNLEKLKRNIEICSNAIFYAHNCKKCSETKLVNDIINPGEKVEKPFHTKFYKFFSKNISKWEFTEENFPIKETLEFFCKFREVIGSKEILEIIKSLIFLQFSENYQDRLLKSSKDHQSFLIKIIDMLL